jgi:amidophosphoribosyltransferase
MGLVSDIFDADVLQKLKGNAAVGHVRYSTAGSSNIGNAQPLSVEYSQGYLAIAHNGNLTNARIIKDELQNYGSIFQSTTDTEVIIHLIALSHENSTLERLTSALKRIEGSYSLVLLTNKELIVARDPLGFRPLALGKIKDAYAVSSETCAFDLIGARYMREIEPGEIIHISHNGMKSYKPFKKADPQFCIFEYIYFARPDSFMFGETVYSVRKDLGRQLAKDTHVDADMVIAIPDSGIGAAIGYSQETGLPFELGLIRNHYVGRTFIEPEESIRHFGVKLKLNAVHDIVKGKRIIVIDDSIVRATTGRKIIKMLRQYGAKEIHFRVSSPPTTHPCFYGIDTPSRTELIASSHTVREINKYMGSDTLRYLTTESLRKAVGSDNYTFCDACFSGKYPSKFPWGMELEQMELFSKR